MNKLEALYDLLHTNLRIKNEGKILGMSNFGYHPECGTTACVAGWHMIYAGVSMDCDGWAKICRTYCATTAGAVANFPPTVEMVWDILFGTNRPDDIDKQIYVTRWFIAREERLQEYNRIRAMPRKERRRLRLAA